MSSRGKVHARLRRQLALVAISASLLLAAAGAVAFFCLPATAGGTCDCLASDAAAATRGSLQLQSTMPDANRLGLEGSFPTAAPVLAPWTRAQPLSAPSVLLLAAQDPHARSSSQPSRHLSLCVFLL